MALKNGLGKTLITLPLLMMMIPSIAHSKGLALSFKISYRLINSDNGNDNFWDEKKQEPAGSLNNILNNNNNLTLKRWWSSIVNNIKTMKDI